MSNRCRHALVQLRGTILTYNVSPNGRIQGAMVDTLTGLAQLNFPKHAAARMVHAMPVGSLIERAVELRHADAGHPIYALLDEGQDEQASGTIARLNYTKRGEVNGCHLSDGTFIHLTPRKAKRYELRVGASITASGSQRSKFEIVVVDAKNINATNATNGHHRRTVPSQTLDRTAS